MFEAERKELENVNIKPSKQRVIILKYLNEHLKEHHSVDDMYSYFKANKINLSLATIYNTINIFKDKKIISAVKMSNGEYRYEKNIDSHIHFECNKCNKVYNMDSMSEDFENKHEGFKIQEEHVLFTGVCPECK